MRRRIDMVYLAPWDRLGITRDEYARRSDAIFERALALSREGRTPIDAARYAHQEAEYVRGWLTL